jgi:2-oxo-4-hydroxy-4-carboxy-5-ureidoimidazoline decarboxylase
MSHGPTSLGEINELDEAAFVARIGPVMENAPWIAAAAWHRRPFPTVAALHDALMAVVEEAPGERQLAFLAGHPELAGKVARAGRMTDHSIAEQSGLGLDRLSDAEFDRFADLNARYRARFAFPFIICVRRHTRDSILASFARRLEGSPAEERSAALAEVGYITRLRLVGIVDGAGKPRTEGRLSTHVLDNVSGRPASSLAVTLTEIGASARGRIAQTVTNADGRTDRPLIGGEPLRIGTYELAFHVGDYFRRVGTALADPPFLDVVPVRFAIAEPEGHYHVPLLVTPWTYSTYRGS